MPVYKILLVDDDKDILYLMAKALRRYGIFEVEDFTQPLLALDHFKSHAEKYHIVVSDIKMPEMSGIELLQQVKNIRPEIPVLAVTAYDEVDDEILLALPTMTKDEIVHKPFKILSVCDVVKQTLHIPASN